MHHLASFSRRHNSACAVTVVSFVMLVAAVGARGEHQTTQPAGPGHDPWAPSQLISPETLARELTGAKSTRPVVVCVGFQVLYRSAHVPGSRYEGPAREAAGLANLSLWASSISKDASIVIYCGCCPMKRCPNVRPAFQRLRKGGFTHVRVLDLPNSFAQDWVRKDYPL